MAELGVKPLLHEPDFRTGFTPPQLAALDGALRERLVPAFLARIKIWDRSGRVLYSDDTT